MCFSNSLNNSIPELIGRDPFSPYDSFTWNNYFWSENYTKIRPVLKKIHIYFLTLIWVDGGVCWFSLNNSKTVKAATLAFCSIQLSLIRDVYAKFGSLYLLQSPDIGQNSDVRISDFWISGQSLMKRNCHNSWTSDDINMELG